MPPRMSSASYTGTPSRDGPSPRPSSSKPGTPNQSNTSNSSLILRRQLTGESFGFQDMRRSGRPDVETANGSFIRDLRRGLELGYPATYLELTDLTMM